jgi:O-antigen/teichoic acid export membrane protein
MHSNIKDKVAIGAGWMIALRWVNRLIGFISIAILARLLLPEDFGVVAPYWFAIYKQQMRNTTQSGRSR